MPTFFQPGPASQPYEAVRDSSDLAHVRDFIEQVWPSYRPNADPHFQEETKTHFHQRTWELYLWQVLEAHGFAPEKQSSEGPDYCITLDGQRTWVEAIAPGRGAGQDAVPPIRTINEMLEAGEEPIAQRVPEEAIILRFTHAIRDKMKKYEEYRAKRIVQDDDQFIIAINGCMATDYRGDPSVPYVIKATIGLGHLQVSIDPTGKEPTESYYQRRSHVLKKNQEPISTELFRLDEYRDISAILYSPKDICNIPEKIGSEMYYFHNPLAKNPFPIGTFKFCREYRADLEQGTLETKDWHIENR